MATCVVTTRLGHKLRALLLARMAGAVARCALVVGALGASGAVAADVPSLDEVSARWKQQREKIASLYVETKSEWESPLSLEELRKVPGEGLFMGARTEEVRFAFKGEKRYSRTITTGEDVSKSPPVPKIRPNATALEKEAIARYAEQEKKRKAMEAGGLVARVATTAIDRTVGFNGKVLWSRDGAEIKRPDGTVQRPPSSVTIQEPRNWGRWFTACEYLVQVGLAGPAPDAALPATPFDLFRGMLPKVLDQPTYSVSPRTEQVDGANCVVLTGSILLGAFTDKLWLDVNRGFAVRQREGTSTFRKGRFRTVYSDFEEITPGFWLPKETVVESIAPAGDAEYPPSIQGRAYLTRRIKLIKWVVNEVPDDLFDTMSKPGDQVQDLRGLMAPGKR